MITNIMCMVLHVIVRVTEHTSLGVRGMCTPV